MFNTSLLGPPTYDLVMPAEPDAPYPEVQRQPSFPALEQAVIDFWRADGTFRASIDQRSHEDESVFYDGPPFANGPPHYGHLITGYVKDTIPRFQTMRGQRVERRFGWDCHGLPIEMAAEKALGVTGRAAILERGVAEFNAYCRSLVGTTAQDWDAYVTRQARWVDMADDYKTMDLPYMESVMWALKSLWDKGLLYEGFRVLPYCWECETPLSNFETRLDDAYRDRQDPALTVTFALETGERLLVWTTTPWTLPSNLAIAVGPDITYAVFEEAGTRYVLGEATVAAYERELAGATRVGARQGAELVGLRYTPLFDYFHDPVRDAVRDAVRDGDRTGNAFRILAGDFVSTEDGTGAVHLAPGFGEDDQRVCEANGIAVVVPVDERGRFTAEVPDYEGVHVFDANAGIIRDLKARGLVVRHDSYVHAYPHCWRTDTPLIYRAVSSWFVRVTAIKDRMLELNQQVNWVPEHVRDGAFGRWLEGARDWSISRNRFWGSPLPVWKSDDPRYERVDVYGSLDELERDFGVRPDDLHRPGIDALTRPNPDDPTGESTMRRIDDVLDCWFESGSMPFAQVHYPFENREWFETHFPAQFICEYIAQTRGWFYTLHVLATALFDCPAFETCVAHGVLLGRDGQKLSKRLGNAPDPMEAFDAVGSDAMRWALLSSSVLRGGDVVVQRRSFDEAVRHVLMPIWNAWYFLGLYANAARTRGQVIDAPVNLLDRYAVAKVTRLADDVGVRLDAYDVPGACAAVSAFLDSLNNWYIRRSRDRFWTGEQAAIDTLHTVLVTLTKVAAPLLPLLTETVYRGLTGERSVHLADWPTPGLPPTEVGDDDLIAAMDAVREVCSAASSVRKANGLRNRLPLALLTVAAPDARALAPYVDIIAEEVNVKRVELTDDVSTVGDAVLQLVPSVLGPRVGPDVQKLLRAVKDGDWSRDSHTVVVAGRTMAQDEYVLRLVPRARAASDGAGSAALPGDRGLVVLDLDTTPELEAEGIARDVVRSVNEARRGQGLHVTDRIHLVLDTGHHDDVRAALRQWHDFVSEQTLARDVVLADGPLSEGHRFELSDGRAFRLALHAV